jgi:GTPase Era involved in 16S rRNA processing
LPRKREEAQNVDRIKIAIAGHTNTGKTTMLRCLTKRSSGELADREHVTVSKHTVHHETLQAAFVDTPGLEKARVALLLKESAVSEGEIVRKLEQRHLDVEVEVIKALKETDIVYYVTSLGVVPDGGFEDEVALIRQYCTRIIGVTNMANKLSTDSVKQGRPFEAMARLLWGQSDGNGRLRFSLG